MTKETIDVTTLEGSTDADLDTLFGGAKPVVILMPSGNRIAFKVRKFRMSEFHRAKFVLSAFFTSEGSASEAITQAIADKFDDVIELLAGMTGTPIAVFKRVPLEQIAELLIEVVEVNSTFFTRLPTLADRLNLVMSSAGAE